MSERKFYKISFPDLRDLCWDVIIKWQDDKSFSDTWLKTKFMQKVEREAGGK